jgi:hypothetical protein
MAMTSGLLLGGCIDGVEEPQQGQAIFQAGAPTTSTDYDTTMAPQTPVTGSPGTAAPAPGDTSVPGATTSVGSPAPGSAPADDTAAPMGTAGSAAPPPDTGTDAPVAGAGDPAAGSGDPADTDATDMPADPTDMPATTESAGTLTVTVTTKPSGGRYAPRNIGAIWIETGSGQFVKTLERWAGVRAADLRAWNAASGGWGFSFFGIGATTPDQMDAITAATLRTHQQHMVSWDMIDNDGQVVPDGPYVVKVEVADDRSVVGQAQFDKGAAPVDISPAGDSWMSLSLSYQP